jgi:hypothetical protein
MTLPIEWIFPLNEERLQSGNAAQLGEYVQELITTLTSMYQNVSQAINGDLKEFIPKVFGTTVAGEGSYSVQDGWVLRQGLMVDVWFSVSWMGHTGSGDAYIQLPYKVKKSLSNPFAGLLHGDYNYGAGYTNMFTLALQDTFKNAIYADGPGGLAVMPLSLLTSGTFFGHIRYIGQEIEN